MYMAYMISPSTGNRVAVEMTADDPTGALAVGNGSTGLTDMRFMTDSERRAYLRDHPQDEDDL